ncbi:MAG: serine--tRNA ligase [Thermodesulfobacteriota bacterium]
MLDSRVLREQSDIVKQALVNRHEDPCLVDAFIGFDTARKEILTQIEALRHKRNVASDAIARMKKEGKNADEHIIAMREVGSKIKELETALAENQEKSDALLLRIPNVPHASVPAGPDETANVVVKTEGTPPAFGFTPRPHDEIGEALGILDFSRAAKIAGARFPLYKGAGALMERALINFMLDIHTTEHGYTECLPPLMVNAKTMTGTGQLPKFEEDLFKLERWGFYLIPTAEVPVTNIFADEILNEADLPVKYTAWTPCFRSEAGSYGKDTKGLIRQHQFNKVELVKFTLPERSYDELEMLLADAETILKRLGLAYRVITLCSGDMGFSAAKTYDIEVWFPSQNRYREISSCSNFEDFQARRAGIRFRRAGKKGTEFVHTLNGSGLAVGRTLAAILENFQTESGAVEIPGALRPYMKNMAVLSL